MFVPFWALFAKMWENEILQEKSSSVTFSFVTSWTPNFTQSTKKPKDPIPKKICTYARTEPRKDSP